MCTLNITSLYLASKFDTRRRGRAFFSCFESSSEHRRAKSEKLELYLGGLQVINIL